MEFLFTFNSSHSITASGTLVVVGFDITNAVKLNTFRTHHGIDSSVILAGPWSGSLSNAGETIELLMPDTLEVPIDGSSPFYPMLLRNALNTTILLHGPQEQTEKASP